MAITQGGLVFFKGNKEEAAGFKTGSSAPGDVTLDLVSSIPERRKTPLTILYRTFQHQQTCCAEGKRSRSVCFPLALFPRCFTPSSEEHNHRKSCLVYFLTLDILGAVTDPLEPTGSVPDRTVSGRVLLR